jgi:hypothetical protein
MSEDEIPSENSHIWPYHDRMPFHSPNELTAQWDLRTSRHLALLARIARFEQVPQASNFQK